MKRYFFIVLSLLILSISCSDKVRFKESDINKYPWLRSFFPESNYCCFEGIHNLDLGTIEFNYYISNEYNKQFFARFDSIATKDQWQTLNANNLERIYSKLDSQYMKTVVSINVDTLNKKLFVKVN